MGLVVAGLTNVGRKPLHVRQLSYVSYVLKALSYAVRQVWVTCHTSVRRLDFQSLTEVLHFWCKARDRSFPGCSGSWNAELGLLQGPPLHSRRQPGRLLQLTYRRRCRGLQRVSQKHTTHAMDDWRRCDGNPRCRRFSSSWQISHADREPGPEAAFLRRRPGEVG